MESFQATEESQQLDAPIVPGPAIPHKQGTPEKLEENTLPYEIVNGIPCYQSEHVIDGIVQVFERIGYDGKVGATYLGIGADGKELVIRVAPSEVTAHVVRMEAAFLCKVEAENEWRFFSQVHKIFQTDDAFHMTLYYRGGPTLNQCFDFRSRKFTIGTAGRLAADVLEIIRCAHKNGYLVRNVNLNCFHFDASCRHLFMADISSILKDLSKTELNIEEPVAAYVGNSDFAPLVHHKNQKISCRQDLESWFYMFISMLKELPWNPVGIEKVGEMKEKGIEGSLFEGLPEQFKTIAEIVIKKDNPFAPVEEEEYEELLKITKEMYQKIGGVVDHEENMDFEREPTPEELPRLVLCRDDEKQETPSDD